MLRKSKAVDKNDGLKFLRVMDANFNRAKEGLRVCEDICRFWLDQQVLTKQFKSVRHRLVDHIKELGLKDMIAGRDVETDCGRETIASESRRKTTTDIFYANCQRVKESLRVLEEFAKLKNVRASVGIKALRYEIYAIEKKVLSLRAFDAK